MKWAQAEAMSGDFSWRRWLSSSGAISITVEGHYLHYWGTLGYLPVVQYQPSGAPCIFCGATVAEVASSTSP